MKVAIRIGLVWQQRPKSTIKRRLVLSMYYVDGDDDNDVNDDV